MHFFYQIPLSSPQDNPESSDKAKRFTVKLTEFQKASTDGSLQSAISLLQLGVQPLFICKPESILNVAVLGKS